MNVNIVDYLNVKKYGNENIKLIHSWKYGNTLPSVIDQRELQEISICREYPYSCLIKLIVEIFGIENSSVLDLTFGIGEFYRFWKPAYLVAFDVVNWKKKGFEWIIEPNEFYETSFIHAEKILGNRKFDIVIFDPPYDIKPCGSIKNRKPWLYHGKENLKIMINYFPKIAKKYADKYVIIKFMDGKEITIFDLVNAFNHKPDYMIIYRFLRADRPRININVLKTHTYILIYKMK